MTRREAREQAFILIFEKSFQVDSEINELVCFAEENEVFVSDDYSVKLATDAFENVEKIDEIVSSNLKGWNYSRISKVAKAILRMAVCEMLFYEDIPVSVSINEAVEIAKKFAGENDPSYINGVLGSVAKSLQV